MIVKWEGITKVRNSDETGKEEKGKEEYDHRPK